MTPRIVLAFVVSLGLAAAPGANAAGPLGVDELMRTVDRVSGPVAVEGVVSQVFPDRKLVALIDAEEFRKCQVVTCASLTLPVEWGGALPAVASTVRAQGEVRKQGVRLLFVASSLETTAPPPASQ